MNDNGWQPDPQAARLDELLERAVEGRLTEAQTEELVLYAHEDRDVAARLEAAARQHHLGAGWLARVHADAAVEKVENSRPARVERGVGLAAVAVGYALHFLSMGFGLAIAVAGVGLLLFSFVRVRLLTHNKDPYKDIKR